jgi:hypothetical protein
LRAGSSNYCGSDHQIVAQRFISSGDVAGDGSKDHSFGGGTLSRISVYLASGQEEHA